MQRLEHGDAESLLRHIACKAQSGRTRTYYGYLDAVCRVAFRYGDVAALPLIVSCKTLQITDGYGWLVHLEVYALALALLFLRTNSTADGWQG